MRQVTQRPFGRTQVVERLEEGGKVGAQHAGHHQGQREDNGGGADGESRVVEEGVEHDSEALAAVQQAEAVEGFDEEHFGGPWEADGHGDEDCEKQA